MLYLQQKPINFVKKMRKCEFYVKYSFLFFLTNQVVSVIFAIGNSNLNKPI